MTDRVERLGWKCHTPNLLAEILTNRGAEALRTPLNIFARLLYAAAARASELDDPALNILMLRLTLYDAADPEKHAVETIESAFAAQEARLQ